MAKMKMYHYSSSDNRHSIEQRGLLASFSDAAHLGGYGCIFLAEKLRQSGSDIDIWSVETSGIPLERDDTTDIDGSLEFQGDKWWMTFQDIPPSHLRRITCFETSKLSSEGGGAVERLADPIGDEFPFLEMGKPAAGDGLTAFIEEMAGDERVVAHDTAYSIQARRIDQHSLDVCVHVLRLGPQHAIAAAWLHYIRAIGEP